MKLTQAEIEKLHEQAKAVAGLRRRLSGLKSDASLVNRVVVQLPERSCRWRRGALMLSWVC